MKPFKTNLFLKVGTIILIGILLLFPTSMIKNLISERENTQRDAINEVSAKWGGSQTITGPIVSIPYNKTIKQSSQNNGDDRYGIEKEYIHFLPSELKIDGIINPEKRNRGIYDIVVYNSNLKISGTFNKIQLSNFDIPSKDILLDKAIISVGIDDLRGIEKQIKLKWNNNNILFNPGTLTNDIIESGLYAPVKIESTDNFTYKFSFELELKGSQFIHFTPVGEITDVNISSKWNNPSFNGAFLPDKRLVNNKGFSANWNILHLNRNYPQMWIGNRNISTSAFGIDLLLPVDNYQKSFRTIKYAILFIGFTFIVFFLIEVLNKIFIHPIQYILVGFALIIFYTLLLSISEYLSYNTAFIISAFSTILLIFGYVKAITKSIKIALIIEGILFILYTFIFVIIQLQDYALLIGSIGIFVILAIIMYVSRKIDWYNLNMEQS